MRNYESNRPVFLISSAPWAKRAVPPLRQFAYRAYRFGGFDMRIAKLIDYIVKSFIRVSLTLREHYGFYCYF
jgi:sialic acid synthase SpsE